MDRKRLPRGRWLSGCGCLIGLCGWALSCGAASIKGLGSSHGTALPGAEYLLQRGLGKEVAGILGHGGRGKMAGSAEGKGTITVEAGINAFLAPAISGGTGVTSDGSLGKGKVVYKSSSETYVIPASVGTQKGGNLFESFSQFDLLQGEVADFQGPTSVQDIIARVTGGSASSIDGTIQSDIASASVTAFGTVSLNNLSKIAIDSRQGGGLIFIRDGNMKMEDSRVSAANLGSSDGGSINIMLAGQLTLKDGSEIDSSTSGLGTGGDVAVRAGEERGDDFRV